MTEQNPHFFSDNPNPKQLSIIESIPLDDSITLIQITPDNIDEIRAKEDKILKEHLEKSDKKLEPIRTFSKDEKKRLDEELQDKIEHIQEGVYTVTHDDIAQAIETILSQQKEVIPSTFYKNIDPSEGFGIERFVLDRVYYLPKLLEDTKLTHTSGITYLVSSEHKDRSGNSVTLEHRFQATNEEEAIKLYEQIASKLAGTQQKIWLACWQLANELKKFNYTCQLTDLMRLAYPERNGYHVYCWTFWLKAV